ncbi:MAG: aldolase [Bacteroidia bacterium]|nr:MAG: aldolase [Bacteroidia bacterium]
MAEKYLGVKFQTHLSLSKISENAKLFELQDWCLVFAKYGLCPVFKGGSGGNLSFRLNAGENKFIITASGLNLNEATSNSDFVEVFDCDMQSLSVFAKGSKKPSSESMLHYSIYSQRSDVNAIFHAHSPAILQAKATFGWAETSREAPYGSMELLKRVDEILHLGNFLIMKNHGFLSLGKSMKQAGENALQNQEKALFSAKTLKPTSD